MTDLPRYSPEAVARPNDNPYPFLNFDISGTPQPAGDVNGDGFADYVYSTSGAGDERTLDPSDTTGKTALYLGTEEPNQRQDQTHFVHLHPVGDVNDDGHDDALRVGPTGSVRIFIGVASGYRSTDTTVESRFGTIVRGFSDLDGDGFSDILLANPRTGAFDVLFGASRVDEVQVKEYRVAPDEQAYAYNTADLNGDGTGSLVRLAGEAPAVQVQQLDVVTNSRTVEVTQSFTSGELRGRAYENDLSLIDVDGSGHREIVATAGNGTPVYVFPMVIGVGGIPAGYATSPERLLGRAAVPVGDLNADGSHDFYSFRRSGTPHNIVFGSDNLLDLSGATGIPFAPTTFAEASFTQTGRLGSVNGDEYDDTILDRAQFGEMPFEVGRRFVYGRENKRVSTDTVALLRRHVYDRVLSTKNIGDINVDGVQDVAATFFDRGKVGLYFGGTGFEGGPDKLLSVGPFPHSMARLDFNGDGVPDLAVVSWGIDRGTSELKIFFGGSGFEGLVGDESDRSVAFQDVAPAGFSNGFFEVANAGDINDDGTDDLLVSAPFSVKSNGQALNDIFVYYGDRTTLGRPNVVINYSDSLGRGFVGAGYRLSGIGDFNGDGIDDFAIGVRDLRNENGTTGRVDVFFGERGQNIGSADLSFRPPADAEAHGYSFGLAGGGDVNGDGISDLLVAPVDFPTGVAAYAYYGGQEGPFGDTEADVAYELSTSALGPRAEAWDADGDGRVNRNYGSVTLADFNRDDTSDVVLNTGFPGSSPLTNAVLFEGGGSRDDGRRTHRPSAILEAPNPNTTLGGAYGATAGDFSGDGTIQYVAVQNRDGNEAYWSSRLYRYGPYDVSLPPPSNVTARRQADRVTVSWDGPEDRRLVGFRVFAGSTPEAATVIDSVGVGTRQITRTVSADSSRYYRVAAVDGQGKSGRYSEAVSVSMMPEMVEMTTWPNPARKLINIRYTLPSASDVDVALYDVLGRRVALLDAGFRSAGSHRVRARDSFPAGAYFVRLSAGREKRVEKVVVLR